MSISRISLIVTVPVDSTFAVEQEVLRTLRDEIARGLVLAGIHPDLRYEVIVKRNPPQQEDSQ